LRSYSILGFGSAPCYNARRLCCVCCVCWKTAREANEQRLARPTQSMRAWSLLGCGCHEHGALWSRKRFVCHACATCTETQGSSRSPGSVLLAHWSYLLELPSARMRQMSRLREPQGSKSGGREGLVAAWLVHFRFLLL
jgi:hypothetical protein